MGIGMVEIVGGALIVLGIFAAFMVWAVFPLLPFLVIGGIYAMARYGVPALGRAALAVERGVLNAVRRALVPVAVWALRDAAPAYARRDNAR